MRQTLQGKKTLIGTLAAAILLGVPACAAPGGRAGTLEVVARVDAALARIETRLDVTVGRIDSVKTQLAEVVLGGGGDSVTAWIYAAIAGAAILYPGIIRPVRKLLENHKASRTTGTATEGETVGNNGR